MEDVSKYEYATHELVDGSDIDGALNAHIQQFAGWELAGYSYVSLGLRGYHHFLFRRLKKK